MDTGHGIADPFIDFCRRQPHVLWAESNILCDGLFKELIFRILEDKTDFLAQKPAVCMLAVEILSVNQDFSGSWLQQAVQVLDQGGLAGTGVADNSDEFPVIDPEADIVERDCAQRCPRRIKVCQVADFNGHIAFSTSCTRSSTVRTPSRMGSPSRRSSSASAVI